MSKSTGVVNNVLVDVVAVDRFAQGWREEHRGQWLEAERLGGFCLLIKRALLERSGPWHAQSGLGVFEQFALVYGRFLEQEPTEETEDPDSPFPLLPPVQFLPRVGTRTFAPGGPAPQA